MFGGAYLPEVCGMWGRYVQVSRNTVQVPLEAATPELLSQGHSRCDVTGVRRGHVLKQYFGVGKQCACVGVRGAGERLIVEKKFCGLDQIIVVLSGNYLSLLLVRKSEIHCG